MFIVGFVVTVGIVKVRLRLKDLSSLSIIRDSSVGIVNRLMVWKTENLTSYLGRRRSFFFFP